MMNSNIETLAEDSINNNDLRLIQLQELEQKIDWDDLVEAIFPHYIQSNLSHISPTVESMLRINILGRHFGMSPSELEEAVSQVDALKEFVLIDSEFNEIPNAACIADFNSLCEEKSLALKIEQELNI